MDEAKEILIHGAHLKGVRNVISNSNGKLPDVSNISAPPLFGQHSEEILRDTLSLSSEKIAALRENKVIN
jgi:crotonobetainyl-CoA:carnitine CoA-transferase CaiB-like acyl-CoA transferase